jgi:hypothetical protein
MDAMQTQITIQLGFVKLCYWDYCFLHGVGIWLYFGEV